MPTYGYSRSITRVAVNPRLAFGVPLDKLCSEGRLHPGLRDLFLKAHLCADSESSLRRKKNQPDLDASDTVLQLLEPGEHGLGTSVERLSLKKRLEAGEWIVATPTSPGAPLWLLEHFLGCLPRPVFGEKCWEQLSEDCRECVEKAVTGSPNICFLIQRLAKCLKRLDVGEFLTVAALLGLMRNLATDGRTTDLNKTAVMALVRYFIPSLVSRPYRPGITSSEDRKKYPLLLFLCYYWPDIREECENLSKESPKTSRCSSLSSIQQKVTPIGQKKCMSLPNNGVDKQRTEQQDIKQSFAKFSLPPNIPQKCIYICRNKSNYNAFKHQPHCIWKPIFLEKEADGPIFCDDINSAFKPASLFICTCCGNCSEKVDRETQCDDSSSLYHTESSEKREKRTEIEYEYASSVHGNCGSESTILNLSRASIFSTNDKFCPCYSFGNDTGDSNKDKTQFHESEFSPRPSAPYLLKNFLTSFTNAPFYTDEASSISCLSEITSLLNKNLKISTNTEEKAEFCSTLKDNVKDSKNMDCLCNEVIRDKDGTLITENSTVQVMQNGLNSANNCERTSSASEQGGNNPQLSSCKSLVHNQAKCEVSYAGRFLKPLSEDDRRHTELLLLQNWDKHKKITKQKHTVAKANTYPPQSSSINKDMSVAAGADKIDERPRRSSEPSALPRIKRLPFKPQKWLREVIGHGRFKGSRRKSSSHKPDTSP